MPRRSGGEGTAGDRPRESVLLADDEPLSLDFMATVLRATGLRVLTASDGDAACEILARRSVDYVFTDLRMPGRDGFAVLADAKAREPERPVVIITAHGTVGVAIDALRRGADDILEKPVAPEDLELAIHRARSKRRLLRENEYLREAQAGDELLVAGPATRRVVDLVERVAKSRAPVLITGPSGTGKELVASLLHRASDRSDGPFVTVNCAAVPEALMESEFFGHEPGAFTGAGRRRVGRFELADGGTLFLDEIAEMALPLQAKLLRVLQEGEVTRVGSNDTVATDARVVCATNRDLGAEVKAGRFREDLLYRLDVVRVAIPPLCARPDEIEPLARHFLGDRVRLTEAALEAIRAHSWPGNVRELQNVLQRATLLSTDGVIDVELLGLAGESVERTVVLTPAQPMDPVQALVGRRLREVEQDLIQATLARCDGNRTRTAEALGISVRTLFNRLQSCPSTK